MLNKMKINQSSILSAKIFSILLFFSIVKINAQQEAQYTQYMYNVLSYNPAYAGSREVISVFGSHRNQWVGLDGAPKTNTLSIHSPINEQLGLGVNFLNDRLGPMDNNNITASFSYAIDIDRFYKIVFGFSGTLDLLNVDYSKLTIFDPYDQRFAYNIDNQLSPNFGAGVFAYSDQMYVGFSVPNILETKHYEHNLASVTQDKIHFYLTGGYVFDVEEYNMKIKPTILTKFVLGAPLQVDFTLNALFNDRITVGLSYRLKSSVSALAGIQVSDNILIGYSYDTDTTKLADYNSGSHEVFLRFELFNKYSKIDNPRFF